MKINPEHAARRVNSPRDKSFKAIDLFSGCGGLTTGLRMAEFNVVGAVEMADLAVKTYRANHPGVEMWDKDIAEVSTKAVMKKLGLKRGELDLLAGCPPCQGFSRLRTRNGKRRMDHPQNQLVEEFFRFVKGLLPKAIMMENVPGLEDYHRFKHFCRGLHQLGYGFVRHQVKNAADYGVPQRRLRLILLASRMGEIEFAPANPNSKTVRDAIALLPSPGSSGDQAHDMKENRSSRIQAMIEAIPLNGGSRSDLPEDLQLSCHRKLKLQCKGGGFKDIYGRMAWDKVSPTITGGCFNPSKGRFLHPTENRAITMREASILQGFPSDYRFPNVSNKEDVALMIGNALPPPFIAAHAREVVKALERPRPVTGTI